MSRTMVRFVVFTEGQEPHDFDYDELPLEGYPADLLLIGSRIKEAVERL